MTKPIFSLTQVIEQLRDGFDFNVYTKWNPATVTYSTNTPPDLVGRGAGYLPMSEALQSQTTLAFELWDDLINISLAPSASIGNITLNYSTTAAGARTIKGFGPISENTAPISYAQIWIEPGREFGGVVLLGMVWSFDGSVAPGSNGFATILHEVGHSLGLTHPGPYDGSANYDADAVYAQDAEQFTVTCH